MDDDIDEAVRFAAQEWIVFRAASIIPDNIGLRVQLDEFSSAFKPQLVMRYRSLKSAPAELILLIMAEGIAASGSLSRSSIEHQLGITLPERPILPNSI